VLITSHLFEAYLKCHTKCFLLSLGETGTGNGYSDWVQAQQASYRSEEINRLTQEAAQNQHVIGPIDREGVQFTKWRFLLETTARTQNLESTVHAVERLISDGQDNLELFVPMRFIFSNKLHKHAKLLLAFDAFVLSEMLGCEVGVGKIVHGDDHATLKVNTGAMVSEVRRITENIDALLSNNSSPDLILNRHCPEVRVSKPVQTESDRERRAQPALRHHRDRTPRPSQQGDFHRYAAFLHFQAPQSTQESKESCVAAPLCVAGARHSGEHCLFSWDSSFP
jgi:hypothetical protein